MKNNYPAIVEFQQLMADTHLRNIMNEIDEHYVLLRVYADNLLKEVNLMQSQLTEARNLNEKFRAALEKIAKPALGSKMQQYIAQQALAASQMGEK